MTDIIYTPEPDIKVYVGNRTSPTAFELESEFKREFFKQHDIDFNSVKEFRYKQWMDNHPLDNLQDCFRLLPYKTEENDYTCIVSMKSNSAWLPVHISYCKSFEKFIRIGVGFNTLPSHRNKLLVPMWRRDWGYLNHVFNLEPSLGHFVTFHGRNKKLDALIRLIKQNNHKSGFLGQPSSLLSEFGVFGPDQIIHNVLQTVAFRKMPEVNLSNEESYSKLVEMLIEAKFIQTNE